MSIDRSVVTDAFRQTAYYKSTFIVLAAAIVGGLVACESEYNVTGIFENNEFVSDVAYYAGIATSLAGLAFIGLSLSYWAGFIKNERVTDGSDK